jgi:hypothetical protein
MDGKGTTTKDNHHHRHWTNQQSAKQISRYFTLPLALVSLKPLFATVFDGGDDILHA